MTVHGLKARWVFPIAGEPLRDGVVWIEGDRIAAIGEGGRAAGARDLGDVAILPGLVNAHAHLELGGFSQPIGRPGIPFVEWLHGVTASRHSGGYDAVDAVRRGLAESGAAGVAALAEIAQPGWPEQLFRQAADRSSATARIDATVFLELIGPTAERAAEALRLAERHIDQGQRAGSWRPALSPHAPYSVRVELVERACRLSAERRFPVAMHLAESREELQLLETGTGPLREFLENLGAWTAAADRRRRPLDYLEMLAAADRALVVHGNYLARDEIAFLADRRETMAVVYCPRTHAWFQHTAYPLEAMLASGVRVALGTDSRASSPNLNLLEDVRCAIQRHPSVPKSKILELATLGGAWALGLEAELGTLEPGKRARLAIVPLDWALL